MAAKQEIIEHVEPAAPAPVASESAAIMQVIERAAMNPNVDIDKMERLLEMQERVMARNARAAYAAAFAEMQPKLPTVSRKGLITIKEKNSEKVIQSTPFALWEDINEAIRPILGEHGFTLSFRTGLAPDGRVTVTAVLLHRDGHQEETTMVLQHDSTGSKNAVQAVGSSTSYGKRYTACALLNITTRGEDDDGKAADQNLASDEQIEEIRNLIVKTRTEIQNFLNFAKIESLDDLTHKGAEAAIAMLKRKLAAQEKR